jgi:hypothetical protein
MPGRGKGTAEALAESWHEASSPYGSQAIAEAKITLDSTLQDALAPIPGLLVNSGAPDTTDNHVALDLSAAVDLGSGQSPGGKMKFSNDGQSWSLAKKLSRVGRLVSGP